MKVKILNKSPFPLPKYETEGSAGLDLYVNEVYIFSQGELIAKNEFEEGKWNILGSETVLVKTGIYLAIPEGYEAQLRSRSGLALKKNLFVLNSPATIDSDYRGEIGVILSNNADGTDFKTDQVIEKGERICQMVFQKVEQAIWDEVENEAQLGITERGVGGFGSTGKQ